MKPLILALLCTMPALAARPPEIDEAKWQDTNAWACAKTIAIRAPRVTGTFKGDQPQDAYCQRFAKALAAGLAARFGEGNVVLVAPDAPVAADVVIESEFATLTAGSKAKRFWVGFGAGKSWADLRLRALRPVTGTVVFSLRQERGSAWGMQVDALEVNVDQVSADVVAYLKSVAETCDAAAWSAANPAPAAPAPAPEAVPATDAIVQPGGVPVSIRTDPDGAEVIVDRGAMGATPMAIFYLTAGDHVVEVRKPGFKPWTRTLTLVAGTPMNIDAQLEPEPREGVAGE